MSVKASSAQIDPWSDVRAAIRQRDLRSFIQLMFRQIEPAPQLNWAFQVENDLWDYKKDCPRTGKDNANAWADLAKEVLGMHNQDGGALVFGISDDYKFAGARNRLDSKQLNDGLRRYLSDRIWVDFNRIAIRSDQSYLGIAIVPPRGAAFERFTADAPQVSGKRLFLRGWSAVRRKDSTHVLTSEDVNHLDQANRQPIVGRQYAIEEPCFRILQPDYKSFVHRPEPCLQIEEGLKDHRVAVVSIVGIGGIGKTALATWAVLRAHEARQFSFIVSITAKDRELTASGIRSLRSELTSFEKLLDNTLDVLGFPDQKSQAIDEKESSVRHLLRGLNGLLYIDNLETVDDTRVVRFLEHLPDGTKAIVTSRRTAVRALVRPVDLTGLSELEADQYIRSLAAEPAFAYVKSLTPQERIRIANACDRIPLVVRWTFSRSRSAAAAMSEAESLTSSRHANEELLEFSFRRIFDQMPADEKEILEVLSLFQRPLSNEALLVGTGLTQTQLEDGVDSLTQDVMVERLFDTDTNDYVFSLRPITRSLVYSELIKQGHKADGIRRRLTDWYEARDIVDESARLRIRELRQGRGNPESALLDLAKAAERNGESENARKLYEQALSRVPTSWRAARDFAEFKRHVNKDRSGALRLYERAAANAPRRGPDRAVVFREYGLLLMESGEPNATDQAIEKFELALAESPNDPIAIFGLVRMLERRGNYDRIIQLTEPLKSNPNPKTREKCLPLLLRAYERTNDILKAAELRAAISES